MRNQLKKEQILWFGVFVLFIIIGFAYFSIDSTDLSLLPNFNNSDTSLLFSEKQADYKLDNDFLLSLVPYVITILVLTFFAFRLGNFLYQSSSVQKNEECDSESGLGAIHFLLLFPLLLMSIFVIFQVAFLIQAKLVINYAAFSAVRAAIVTIPARVRSSKSSLENRNVILASNPDSSAKMQIIRRAAAFSCLSISPELSPRLIIKTGIIPTAYGNEKFSNLKLAIFAPKADYVKQTVRRWGYAYDSENTKVEVLSFSGRTINKFNDHGLVTVKVTHRYYLTVPFADRLLGKSFGGIFSFFTGSAFYYPITEQYTLLNEGEPIYPDDDSHKRRFNNSEIIFSDY